MSCECLGCGVRAGETTRRECPANVMPMTLEQHATLARCSGCVESRNDASIATQHVQIDIHCETAVGEDQHRLQRAERIERRMVEREARAFRIVLVVAENRRLELGGRY